MSEIKRFSSSGTFKRNVTDVSSSDDDSESGDNWHKKMKHDARNWNEIDLQTIGIHYERAGLACFGEELNTCALVCHSNDLSPVAREIITLLEDCLDFDLKLEKGTICGANVKMGSEEIIERLKMARLNLKQKRFEHCNPSVHESNSASNRTESESRCSQVTGNKPTCVKSKEKRREENYIIKSQSLHSAHMFIRDILMQVTHEQRQTQQHVVEGFFTMMISHFGSMCNLEPRAPFYKHIVNIKGNYVTAIPDVRFTYASTDETDGSVLTVSVVEVKKSSRKTGNKVKKNFSPGSSDSSCSEDEMTVFDIHNFVGEDVLGQHGIQLLAESFYSAKHNKQAQASHVFGMIMVGVQVIFTCLQISDQEVKSINAFGNTDAPRRGIKYSKPLNILSSSDRRQVYEILFRLSEEIDLTQTVNHTS